LRTKELADKLDVVNLDTNPDNVSYDPFHHGDKICPKMLCDAQGKYFSFLRCTITILVSNHDVVADAAERFAGSWLINSACQPSRSTLKRRA